MESRLSSRRRTPESAPAGRSDKRQPANTAKNKNITMRFTERVSFLVSGTATADATQDLIHPLRHLGRKRRLEADLRQAKEIEPVR